MSDKEHSGLSAIVFSGGFLFLLIHLATVAWLYTQPGAIKGIIPHEFIYEPTFQVIDLIRETRGMNVGQQRLAFAIGGSIEFIAIGIVVDLVMRAGKIFSGS